MGNGDINMYLKRNPDSLRLLLASDVAKGLLYLHKNGIIHGDLKGVSWTETTVCDMFTNYSPQPNILIDGSGRARLADFGISAVSDSNIIVWTSQSSGASKGGSVRWQAPELFDVENDEEVKNSPASDVYAWGCVAFEVFTGTVPFANIQRDTSIALRVKSGGRPTRPRSSSKSWKTWGLTEEVWSLMERSWQGQPAQRPTSAQIVEQLEMMISHDPRPMPETCIFTPEAFRHEMDAAFEIVTTEVFDLILENASYIEDNESAVIPRPFSEEGEYQPRSEIQNHPLITASSDNRFRPPPNLLHPPSALGTLGILW
ncbi:hypothetical protein H0H92_010055 [Tricholoma furcatifolium]|nr:hypothetical protein H0H92_010055 [Tricholoma furcatifolium]